MPDADGKLDDIALGWDDPTRYEVREKVFFFRGDDEQIEKEKKTSESARGRVPSSLAPPFKNKTKNQTRPPLSPSIPPFPSPRFFYPPVPRDQLPDVRRRRR